jgi:hypothetical protein
MPSRKSGDVRRSDASLPKPNDGDVIMAQDHPPVATIAPGPAATEVSPQTQTPSQKKEKDGSKDKDSKDSKDKDATTIDDLSLPKSIITRLAKGVLPPNTQIQANAILAMSKSATVFISHLASA